MSRIKRDLSILGATFFQRVFISKTVVLIVLLWLITELFLSPIKRMAYGINELISPGVLSYLMSNYTYLLLFMLGVIYFYSDVPFTYRSQLYYIFRQGKRKWMIIQLLYIFLTAPLLMGLSLATVIIQILPVINTSTGWGRVLGTLALTNASKEFGVAVTIDYEMMTRHSPSAAIIYTMGIGTLVIFFIGVLMLLVSVLIDRFWAMVLASLLAFIPSAQMIGVSKIDYFSPVSWMRLTKLGYGYRYNTPQLNYILTSLIILNVSLILVVVILIGKKDIKWIEEV